MEYKLKELFDLQMGKTPSRNNSDYWNTKDNKWISIADLSKCEKYITDTKEYISDIAIKESGINPIPANTVVMSFKLSIGKTAITKEVIYSNEAIMSFRDKKTIELLPDYTYYLMMSKRWDEGTNKAVMGKTLNKATLSEIKVSVHDIAEQQRIVNVLDKLTALIDKRKKQLKKLDELVKSRFVEMFGDPINNSKKLPTNKLKDILVLKAGDFTSAADIVKKPTMANIYPCYGGNGIRGYVSEYNQEGEYSLIGRQGALSGNVQYAKGKFKNTEHALLVTPLIKINSIWLNQLLLNLDLKRYQTGAAQPGLSVKNLQEIQIIDVSIEEQNQFAAFVKQIDKSKFEIKQSLEKLELLKKALMQKYFG